jgi:glycerol kinase
MFTAAKLHLLLDHDDGTRQAARAGTLRTGTVDAWLPWRLTGGAEYACEIENASRTVARPRLVPLGLFGVTQGVFSVPDGLPVLAILGDSHAALPAQAGSRPRVVKATFGTGCSVMATIPPNAQPSPGVSRTIAWQDGTNSPVTTPGLPASRRPALPARPPWHLAGAIELRTDGGLTRALAEVMPTRDAMYYIMTGGSFDGCKTANCASSPRLSPRSSCAAGSPRLPASSPR